MESGPEWADDKITDNRLNHYTKSIIFSNRKVDENASSWEQSDHLAKQVNHW